MSVNSTAHRILPFQFSRFDNDFLLVNESGEYIFLGNNEFHGFIQGTLGSDTPAYVDLKSRHFLNTEHLPETLELVAAKYRSRKRFISNFTALHMMVITLRCCNDCTYCQVTAEGDDAKGYDMSPEVARRVVDYIFKTPSPTVKIEFQGGEPTLNWETLKETVLYAERINRKQRKNLEFVVCTNLVKIDDSMLRFFQEHRVQISTSLDGPKEMHDRHRVLRSGGGTYDNVTTNMYRAFDIVLRNSVNALMTTTADNIDHLQAVIDEYVRLGLSGVFIRALNPYGLATKNNAQLGYPAERFVAAFEKALDYIIQLNLKGTRFVEYYTTILLTRILTPFSTGFVDLQSPSGAGISGAIYDHNGDVFPADEARMLARMGDCSFCLGNVYKDSYEDIFGGKLMHEIVGKSCVEIMPYCGTCVYRSYCGADPVRNYRETGDMIGRRPNDDFCTKNRLMFDMLFRKLKRNDPDEMDVFWSWITCRNLDEVKRGADETV
jgi:His-Xaa-Ser system radical SAM maturase HxsB